MRLMRYWAILLALLACPVAGAASVPTVVSVSPAAGSLYVDIFSQIVITFSEPMDHPSTEAACILELGSAGSWPVTYSWSDPATLVLTPSIPMREDDGGYAVWVRATALALDGTPLADGADSPFTTAALLASGTPLPAPITSLIHLGAATDHVTSSPGPAQSLLWDHMLASDMGPEQCQQPAPGVTIPFLFGANQTSMTWQILNNSSGGWFADSQIGMIDYSGVYLLVPSDRPAQLAVLCGAPYSAWLDGSAIASGAGSGATPTFMLTQGMHVLLMKSSGAAPLGFSLSLTDPNGTAFTDLRQAPESDISPSVTLSYPADGATDVNVFDDIIVQFSEPMQTQVAPGSVCSIVSAGVNPPGTWSWRDPCHLCFRPSAPLAPSTTYSVETTWNGVDLSGLWQPIPRAFTFVTQGNAAPAPTALVPSSAPSGGGATCLLTASSLRTRTTYPVGAIPFQGNRYSEQLGGLDFADAEANCVANGGHLAAIGSSQEDAFVWQLGGRLDAWIGLDDAADGATWSWVDGEPISYANWAAGEPANANPGQFYATYSWGMQWSPAADGARTYVIECEPQGPQAQLTASGLPTIPLTLSGVGSAGAACSMPLSGARPGTYDLTVVNPDGTTGTLPGAFTVTRPAGPSVAAVASSTSATAASVSWTSLDGAEAVVVRRPAAASPTQPGDGSTLVAGSPVGAGTVVAATTSSSYLDNGLQPATSYAYDVFALMPGSVYSLPGSATITTSAGTGTSGATASSTTTSSTTSSSTTSSSTTSSSTTSSSTTASSTTSSGTSDTTAASSTGTAGTAGAASTSTGNATAGTGAASSTSSGGGGGCGLGGGLSVLGLCLLSQRKRLARARRHR